MYSLLDAALMFFLYAFFGWILEVVYYGITQKKFVNRGFLYGPVCPIYGAGGTVVVLCLTPLKGFFPALYVSSVILTSVIEFLTGYVLEKLYHIRWWDYSDRKFNIKGYICPQFSLAWGVACTALMYFIHPLLYDTVIFRLGNTVKLIAVILLGIVFIADLIATVNTLKKLNLRIDRINEIARRLHEISDNIGEHVYDRTELAMKKYDELAEDEKVKTVKAELIRKQEKLEREREELRRRNDMIIKEMSAFQKRIVKAFPKMEHKQYKGVISRIREKIEKSNG
jgi:uncharacterized membrane protein